MLAFVALLMGKIWENDDDISGILGFAFLAWLGYIIWANILPMASEKSVTCFFNFSAFFVFFED